MITLTRRYTFEAAHHLTGLREGHKCMRPHGHNYRLELTVAPAGAELRNGFVIDAFDLDRLVRQVVAEVDHHDLNQHVADIEATILSRGGPAGLPVDPHTQLLADQPTAENIALWFAWRLEFLSNDGKMRLLQIRLYETEDIWATWTP